MSTPDTEYTTRLLRTTRHAQRVHNALRLDSAKAKSAYANACPDNRAELYQHMETIADEAHAAGKEFWRLLDEVTREVCEGRVDVARQMVEREERQVLAERYKFLESAA